MDPETVENAGRRAWRKYVRNAPRTPKTSTCGIQIPHDFSIQIPLAERAIRWLFAWESIDYPGIIRGTREALGLKWGKTSVQRWRKGRSRFLKEAAERIVAIIDARLDAGHALSAELHHWINTYPERPRRGWELVRERDGVIRDGRGKGGRPKTGV